MKPLDGYVVTLVALYVIITLGCLGGLVRLVTLNRAELLMVYTTVRGLIGFPCRPRISFADAARAVQPQPPPQEAAVELEAVRADRTSTPPAEGPPAQAREVWGDARPVRGFSLQRLLSRRFSSGSASGTTPAPPRPAGAGAPGGDAGPSWVPPPEWLPPQPNPSQLAVMEALSVITRHGEDDAAQAETGPFWCLRLVLVTAVFTSILVAAGHAASCRCFVHVGHVD